MSLSSSDGNLMMSLNLDSIENEVLTAPEDVYELAGGAAEVPRVLAAARRAAAWWRTLSVKERANWLLRFRRELVDRLDEIVAVVGQEINKPRFDAINEVMQCGLLIGCHARRGPKILRSRRLTPGLQWNKRAAIHYRPLGVVGCITPWNYPVALPLMSAVPALLAGNAVILKPSRLALRTALYLQEAFNALGPPEPVFQVLAGDRATGVALAGSGVDKLVFVGGSRGARAIAQAAAARFTPLLLELGGNDPMIVAADADVERRAGRRVGREFFNAGQSCVAIERCYVDRTIAEPFIERVVEIARGLSQGFSAVTAPESLPGPDWDHDLGPIRTAEHLAEVRELLADAIAQGRGGPLWRRSGGRRRPLFSADRAHQRPPRDAYHAGGGVCPAAAHHGGVQHGRGDRLGQRHPLRTFGQHLDQESSPSVATGPSSSIPAAWPSTTAWCILASPRSRLAESARADLAASAAAKGSGSLRYPVGGGAPLWHAASVSLVPLPRQAPLDGPHCPLDVRLPIFAALAGINAAAKPRPPTRRGFACRTTGICRRPNASPHAKKVPLDNRLFALRAEGGFAVRHLRAVAHVDEAEPGRPGDLPRLQQGGNRRGRQVRELVGRLETGKVQRIVRAPSSPAASRTSAGSSRACQCR